MELGWFYWIATWLIMTVAFLTAWICIIGGCIRMDRGGEDTALDDPAVNEAAEVVNE